MSLYFFRQDQHDFTDVLSAFAASGLSELEAVKPMISAGRRISGTYNYLDFVYMRCYIFKYVVDSETIAKYWKDFY